MASRAITESTRAMLLVALVALLPAAAYGHKLNVFASAEGKTIQGKVYFSGGTRPKMSS